MHAYVEEEPLTEFDDAIFSNLCERIGQLGPQASVLRGSDTFLSDVARYIRGDLFAYCAKDPASHNKHRTVLETYVSFAGTLFYRISHAIRNTFPALVTRPEHLASKAANIGKTISGIEIHPAAIIGARFVIDHGMGTVIGETSIVGNDCYFLGGITLGAKGIANNPSGRRHPTVGNHVEIGKNASVLGNIDVGDNCFIGPDCVIKHNLAPGSRVTLINQLQITRGSGVRHVCEGAINLGDKLLVSYRQATSPAFFITGATGTKKLLESTPCDFLEGSYVIKIDQSDRVASNKQRLLTIEDDRNVLIHLLF